MITPLALLSLIFGRRKKGSQWINLLIVLSFALVLGMYLSACGPAPTPTPGGGSPTTPPPNQTPLPPGTNPGTTPTPGGTPSTPPAVPCPTPPTITPGPSGTVYLTIDDGPGVYTSSVLDVLSKYNIKATFFLIGQKIGQYPQEVRRIYQEGHAIGVHSWDHPDYWGGLSTEEQNSQIQRTQQALLSVLGVESNLFRAPGGGNTTANISGLYNYNWTHNTFDYCYGPSDAQTVANNVFEGIKQVVCPDEAGQEKYTQGIAIDNFYPRRPIVLIHSIHQVDPSALELLIVGFQSRGYSFGTLPRPGDSPGTGPIATFN